MNKLARIGVAAALTVGGLAGIQFANPVVASARCAGYIRVDTTLRNEKNLVVAKESPAPGTCDYNETYTTTLSAPSGWTPALYTENGGDWVPRKYGRGTVAQYSKSHQTEEFLCAFHANGGAWCGADAGNKSAAFCIDYGMIELIVRGQVKYQLPADTKPCLFEGISTKFGLLNSGF